MKQETIEETIIPPEVRNEMKKQIKTSIIIKMEQYKISKLLADSTVSKFVTKKKWIDANDLSDS